MKEEAVAAIAICLNPSPSPPPPHPPGLRPHLGELDQISDSRPCPGGGRGFVAGACKGEGHTVTGEGSHAHRNTYIHTHICMQTHLSLSF